MPTSEEIKAIINKNLFLTQEQKDFWLVKIPTLPQKLQKNILEIITNSNSQSDEFIKLALAEDKDHKYLNELNTVINQTEKNINQSTEEKEKSAAEEEILKQIQNL